MRTYKKDFTLKQLQEVLNREALPPNDPVDTWDHLAVSVVFTTIEIRVGK